MLARHRKLGLVDPRLIGLAVGLLALAVIQLIRGFDPGTSIDLYQFWAVPAARSSVAGLPTPYVDLEATRSVLPRLFAHETDPRILRVHRFRMGEFEPFASPLLYLSFSLLPDDYAVAVRVHWLVQVLAFSLGLFTLLWLAGVGPAPALAGVAALALVYRPFADDLFTGNLGSIQLAGVALVLWIAERRIPGASRGARTWLTASALVVLGWLVLVKANLAPAALLLVVHLARAAGVRGFGRALLLSGIGLAAMLVAPLLWFGSASAWGEWLALIVGRNPGRLAEYALAAGNTSTPRLCEEWLGVDPLIAAAGVGVLLAASIAPLARRIVNDAWLAAGVGVVVTLAMAPLVWFHYFVLALVPAIRLLASPGSPRWLGVLALALYSLYQPELVSYSRAFVSEWLAPLWSVAWLALWSGLWIVARRQPEESASALE